MSNKPRKSHPQLPWGIVPRILLATILLSNVVVAEPRRMYVNTASSVRTDVAVWMSLVSKDSIHLWTASSFALVGAEIADAATAWGKPEANPLLGSRFGPRAAAIKGGAVAGLLVAEWRWGRGWRRGLAIMNFAVAGVLGAVAIHNRRVR